MLQDHQQRDTGEQLRVTEDVELFPGLQHQGQWRSPSRSKELCAHPVFWEGADTLSQWCLQLLGLASGRRKEPAGDRGLRSPVSSLAKLSPCFTGQCGELGVWLGWHH